MKSLVLAVLVGIGLALSSCEPVFAASTEPVCTSSGPFETSNAVFINTNSSTSITNPFPTSQVWKLGWGFEVDCIGTKIEQENSAWLKYPKIFNEIEWGDCIAWNRPEHPDCLDCFFVTERECTKKIGFRKDGMVVYRKVP